MPLHLGQQLHRAPFVEQEVLVHHEERVHLQRAFDTAHHVEELLAGFVEVDVVALAPEKRGRRAEVAAHRAADRRDDRGGRIAAAARRLEPHQPESKRGGNGRVRDGRIDRLAEERPEPPNALPGHDVIGVDHGVELRERRDVPADDDRRSRRVLAHEPAHLLHLADVHDDARNAHDVVGVGLELAYETLARGKIEHRGRCRDDAPRAMRHAERKRILGARHLIVVQLHRVDGAAAELVVLREGTEDRGEENAHVRDGSSRFCVHAALAV